MVLNMESSQKKLCWQTLSTTVASLSTRRDKIHYFIWFYENYPKQQQLDLVLFEHNKETVLKEIPFHCWRKENTLYYKRKINYFSIRWNVLKNQGENCLWYTPMKTVIMREGIFLNFKITARKRYLNFNLFINHFINHKILYMYNIMEVGVLVSPLYKTHHIHHWSTITYRTYQHSTTKIPFIHSSTLFLFLSVTMIVSTNLGVIFTVLGSLLVVFIFHIWVKPSGNCFSLSYFIQHNHFKVHSFYVKGHNFIFFNDKVVFHWEHIP